LIDWNSVRLVTSEELDKPELGNPISAEIHQRLHQQQKWKLTEIYADEAISGGSVKERDALLTARANNRNP